MPSASTHDPCELFFQSHLKWMPLHSANDAHLKDTFNQAHSGGGQRRAALGRRRTTGRDCIPTIQLISWLQDAQSQQKLGGRAAGRDSQPAVYDPCRRPELGRWRLLRLLQRGKEAVAPTLELGLWNSLFAKKKKSSKGPDRGGQRLQLSQKEVCSLARRSGLPAKLCKTAATSPSPPEPHRRERGRGLTLWWGRTPPCASVAPPPKKSWLQGCIQLHRHKMQVNRKQSNELNEPNFRATRW